MDNVSAAYTVADYLFQRVYEAGASDIFGVPGDFNLKFLDTVIASDKLHWVGNTNELNAGYAADGYARERGFAALVTTFGVGELSAINATAGSFTEYAPVLHIVGAPHTRAQKDGKMLHHTLGDGYFEHFMNMANRVNAAQAKLTAENAATEIDRVIRTILREHRPGYLMLPVDVAQARIYPPSVSLREGITTHSSQAAIDAFEQAARKELNGRNAMILADLLVHRMGVRDRFDALIAETDLPYATLSWGKTLLDESSPRWVGTYAGAASNPEVKEAVEGTECLIEIGVIYTDNTTAGFSHNLNPERGIMIGPRMAQVAGETFAPLDLADSIAALHRVLKEGNNTAQPFTAPAQHQQQGGDDEALRQVDLWPLVAAEMDDGNMLFADQGTAFFGLAPVAMPAGVTFYAQPMWGSIGYTLPAMLGAAMASRDKRGVLAIGDGAALLTVQDIAVMLREQIHPVLLIVNNDGYTVERAIHGPDQPYNDIPKVSWQHMLPAFGGDDNNSLYIATRTPRELRQALARARDNRDKLVMIEIFMHRDDLPPLLKFVADALQNASKQG